jgi:SAM-dependent methyltransferase
MTTLFLKAQIKNAHTADLFAVPVPVKVHVAHGRLVGPYIAVRHKAPPDVSHPKAVIVHAHKAELEGIIAQLKPMPAAPDDEPPMVITTTPPVDLKAEAQRKAQAKKLRDAADKIIAAGEDSLGRDRQANTRKRVQDAASAIDSAQKEIQLGETMRNLAAAIESGDAVALSSITSRAAVEQLVEQLAEARVANWRKKGQGHGSWEEMHRRPVNAEDIVAASLPVPKLYGHTTRDLVEAARVLEVKGHDATVKWLDGVDADDGVAPTAEQTDRLRALMADLDAPIRAHKDNYKSHYTKRNAARSGSWGVNTVRKMMTAHSRFAKMGITSDEQLRAALTEFAQYRTMGKRAEDPIKAAERALVGTKPGIDFFPTPPPLAQRMVQLADVQPGERVLEPSAGKGDIADAIRAAGGKVEAVELSETLRKVLTAKGHTLVGTDFEAFDSHEGQYDAIVMNPPWSGGADVRHVMRAYTLLKPGGRLVALMSMHPSFAQDKASQAFRGWMEEMGAASEKIPADDFKSQWMSGGIPSWLVHVEKPMAKALFLRPAA